MDPLLTTVGVLAAGALGAVARWLLSRLNGRTAFPLGTLAANTAGSFLLGVLTARGGPATAIVGTGLLGSFTTFSTLMNEVVDQATEGNHKRAVVYLSITLLAGVAAATIGLQLA